MAGQNRLDYNGGKINADNFLVQLDVTPHMDHTNVDVCAADLKIALKNIVSNNKQTNLQVRFSYKNNLIYIEKIEVNEWSL